MTDSNTALGSLRGRRVAVTGAGGFLGKAVCRELKRYGAAVLPVLRRDFDLVEQARVRALYAELKPDVLVHGAAACGGIGANVASPGEFFQRNALMGLMLLDEGRLAGLEKFVLISTTCAYPADAPMPLREESLWQGRPAQATAPYGLAKRMLHEACAAYETQYRLSSAVLIPANLYGPEDHFEEARSHVIPALTKRYEQARVDQADQVINWGTGEATREFLYVDDAARGIALACACNTSAEPMNLGTGQEVRMRELASLIAELTGFAGETCWDDTKPEGTKRRSLDVQRARRTLGFEAKTSLRDGLRATLDWYRDAKHSLPSL